MLKYFIPLAAAAMLMGCEAGVGIHPRMSSSRQETAQLAAYAANTDYPANAKATWSDDWHVAVMTKGNNLTLINYNNHPIGSVNVWVNGIYVHNVASIPARGTTVIAEGDFFNKNGQAMSFDSTALGAAHFEIQSGNDLYMVMGPIAQP